MIISSNLFNKSKDIIKWLAEKDTIAHEKLIEKHFHNSFHLSNHRKQKKMNIQSIYFQFHINSILLSFQQIQSFVSGNLERRKCGKFSGKSIYHKPENFIIYWLWLKFTRYMHGIELQFKVPSYLRFTERNENFPFLWHSRKV